MAASPFLPGQRSTSIPDHSLILGAGVLHLVYEFAPRDTQKWGGSRVRTHPEQFLNFGKWHEQEQRTFRSWLEAEGGVEVGSLRVFRIRDQSHATGRFCDGKHPAHGFDEEQSTQCEARRGGG